MNFSLVNSLLAQAIPTVTPAAQLVIRLRQNVIDNISMGFLDPQTQTRPTRPDSLFDLASITKLYTTTAFMTLVEQGSVNLDTPVSVVLPEFTGLRPIQPYENPLDWEKTVSISQDASQVDAGKITFRQLLTHTSGLPAWRPLKDQPNAESAYQMALGTFFSYPPGEQVVYSDIGLILLGLAVSRLTGQPLEEAIYQRVTRRNRLPG